MGNQPGQPTGNQPGQPMGNQPGQPTANQPGQPGQPAANGQPQSALAQSTKSLQQAAQALAQAAQQLQPSQGQGTPGQGTPSQPGGSPSPAGQPNPNQQANTNPSDSSPSFPSTGDGKGATVPVDLKQLDSQLKKLTNRQWGHLPGRLQSEILQAARRKPSSDYAKLIKAYFKEIAKTNRTSPTAP